MSEDTEVTANVINRTDADGILLLGSGEGASHVYLNDIHSTGGFAAFSDEPIELSDGGIGNWWNGDCGRGLFEAGEHSNDIGVVDSFPYLTPVASDPVPPDPGGCPH